MAIPDAIAGAPILREDLRWVWDAFSDLTTERAPGSMGPPGHIPWRAMLSFAQQHRLTGAGYQHFKELIKAMDDVYLEHIAAEIKASKES